jgi:hypothetical protein
VARPAPIAVVVGFLGLLRHADPRDRFSAAAFDLRLAKDVHRLSKTPRLDSRATQG